MSSHPINLALRFLLEIAALLALGVWGWQSGEGWLQFGLALGIPLVAAALWATFRIPNDPGAAPVAVPGLIRLILEIAFFALAVWGLYQARLVTFAWILGLTVALHYLISYDRILWMIKQ